MSKHDVGRPTISEKQHFVQTERAAHIAWSKLIEQHPRSAQLLHLICAHMDRQNALVASQKTLGKLMGCTDRTVRNALKPLIDQNFIQMVRVGPAGSTAAYVVNSRIAWADRRDNLRGALFSAQVLVDADDQDAAALSDEPLKRLPLVHPPEEALPAGDVPHGGQGHLPSLEPVVEGLPHQTDIEDFTQ